ncbi:hypothetical protein JAAARDRAFT_199368 [Jaapia argillacea MUCL 33604]|uniref:Uncharacterized protein n=1 Tax=Jaapia argillacea MUCL 33604 TaxID=933084 RepID=A0A067PL10_9AGAM|nr:hypothetical protein JAAARDRAFT_199368 [Jaapia argillacea MUCL 33604]
MGDVGVVLGAVLCGGFVSLALTGIVNMQAFSYFRRYKSDYTRVRLTVLVVWYVPTPTMSNTSLVCSANWQYLINHWGDNQIFDHISLPIALSVGTTAMITFIIHSFFIRRVLVLSNGNWFICGPMFLLAFLRLRKSPIAFLGCLLLSEELVNFSGGFRVNWFDDSSPKL